MNLKGIIEDCVFFCDLVIIFIILVRLKLINMTFMFGQCQESMYFKWIIPILNFAESFMKWELRFVVGRIKLWEHQYGLKMDLSLLDLHLSKWLSEYDMGCESR